MPGDSDPIAQAHDHSDAIGRTERSVALIAAERVEALARTLDLETVPGGGSVVPPGWHASLDETNTIVLEAVG